MSSGYLFDGVDMTRNSQKLLSMTGKNSASLHQTSQFLEKGLGAVVQNAAVGRFQKALHYVGED